MKKSIILIITVILPIINCTLFAQLLPPPNHTVWTPNASPVEALNKPEYSAGDIASIDSYMDRLIVSYGWETEVKRIGNASATYNCHSYAWHVSEGGGACWINVALYADYQYPNLADPPINHEFDSPVGVPGIGNISQYWKDTDESYIEVDSSIATKVFYGTCGFWKWGHEWYWGDPCDHSAVRITSGADSGKYISKFGDAGLYIHPVDKSLQEYNISHRKFYMRTPVIQGSGTVCFSGSLFTVDNLDHIPSGNITWSVTGPFTVSPATGNQVTINKAGSSISNGTITVKANGFKVATKPINACTEKIIVGPDNVCYNGSDFFVNNPPLGDIEWSVTGPFILTVKQAAITVARTEGAGSSGTLTATFSNGGGYTTKIISACTAAVLSGSNPETVCYSGTTYNLSNSPGNIYWKVSNTGIFSLSETTNNSVKVTRTGTTAGSATLSAHYGSVNGTLVASKTINACVPAISGTNPEEVCYTGKTFTLSNKPPNVTNVVWTVSSSSLFSVNSSTGNVTRTGSATGSATLYARDGSTSGPIIAQKTITACAPPVINGSSDVCNTSSISLSYNPGVTVYWTVSNGYFSLSSTTGTSITVTSNGTIGVNATLSAHTGSTSGTVIATKTINSCQAVITGPSSINCGYSDVFTISTVPGATYQWFSGDIVTLAWPSSTTSATYKAPDNLWWDEEDVIYCKINGTSYTKRVTAKSCYSPVKPYPNPVADILNIEIELDADAILRSRGNNPNYDIRLYDGMGNLVRSTATRSITTQFNVVSLPNGIYYLHVYNGLNDKPVVQQIVVQH